MESSDTGYNDVRQQTGARRVRWPQLLTQHEGRIDAAVHSLKDVETWRPDSLALAAVLRSPLCGLSDNALLGLRCAPLVNEVETGAPLRGFSATRPLYTALRHHEEIAFISPEEHELLDRAAKLIGELVPARITTAGIQRVLQILQAASRSLAEGGTMIDLDGSANKGRLGFDAADRPLLASCAMVLVPSSIAATTTTRSSRLSSISFTNVAIASCSG